MSETETRPRSEDRERATQGENHAWEAGYAAGRKAERDHLREWVNTELRDIADYPDVTSGDAIWQESGYVQALRDVLAEIEGRDHG